MRIEDKLKDFKQHLKDKKTYKAFQESLKKDNAYELYGRANQAYEESKDINYHTRLQRVIVYGILPALGLINAVNSYDAFSSGQPILGVASTALGALSFGLTGSYHFKAGGIKGIMKETRERKERNKKIFNAAKLYANKVTNQKLFDVSSNANSNTREEKTKNNSKDSQYERKL